MSIVSSRVKIYGDSALTNLVATVNGTTSLTQAIAVTNLNSATSYWAVAEATDNNNLTGYSASQMFTTSGTSYIFSNIEVEYEYDYSSLYVGVNVSGPSGAHFTECGVEFSLSSDFTGQLITDANTSGVANYFAGDVSGFAEHTLYFYRFYATTTEYGTQYYTPTNNTITTHYDTPILAITTSGITDTRATVSFLYSGNMPVDPTAMSATIGAVGSQNPVSVQFDYLVAGTPMPVTLSGLTPGTIYQISWDVTYYNDEVSQVGQFTTLGAAPTVAITSITDITPTSATINLSIS